MKIGHHDLDERIMIVAELSANHGQDINIAKKTIKAACDSGADAIKTQTYTADTLTIDSRREYFLLDGGTPWDGRTYYDLYSEGYLPWHWQQELMDYSKSLGMLFFSTPFDKTAVDFLTKLDVPCFKVASFEAMDLPLVEYIASKGKPIIVSTGVISLSEIDEVVTTCRSKGNDQIVLLKCTSSYPSKVEDANLLTIPNIRDTFGVRVGVSDHTMSISVPVLSVALGARLIEKHFILDRNIGGPDASFSLTPSEFTDMVDAVRDSELALGQVSYELTEKKKANRMHGRSLFVVSDIKAGETFNETNIRSIRPGYGLEPKYLSAILGKTARLDLQRGEPMKWEYVE